MVKEVQKYIQPFLIENITHHGSTRVKVVRTDLVDFVRIEIRDNLAPTHNI